MVVYCACIRLLLVIGKDNLLLCAYFIYANGKKICYCFLLSSLVISLRFKLFLFSSFSLWYALSSLFVSSLSSSSYIDPADESLLIIPSCSFKWFRLLSKNNSVIFGYYEHLICLSFGMNNFSISFPLLPFLIESLRFLLSF
jgi:hypothetical protein